MVTLGKITVSLRRVSFLKRLASQCFFLRLYLLLSLSQISFHSIQAMLCTRANSCLRRRNTEIQTQLKSKLRAWIIFLLPAIMLLLAYWKHWNFHTDVNKYSHILCQTVTRTSCFRNIQTILKPWERCLWSD